MSLPVEYCRASDAKLRSSSAKPFLPQLPTGLSGKTPIPNILRCSSHTLAHLVGPRMMLFLSTCCFASTAFKRDALHYITLHWVLCSGGQLRINRQKFKIRNVNEDNLLVSPSQCHAFASPCRKTTKIYNKPMNNIIIILSNRTKLLFKA